MNRHKQLSETRLQDIKPNRQIEELIDLYVELCFEDINDINKVSQFQLLGMQLGYGSSQIRKVIELGKSEYRTLLDEIHTAYVESELV